MKEKNIEKMCKLIDAYGVLLTEHQINVLRMYYEDDFSLQEISEVTSSSRSAVSDVLKRTEKTLLDYEEKLHLVEKEDSKYGIVMVLADDASLVEKMKKEIIDNNLAVVVQVVDTKSNYRWKNKIYDEKEFMLLIKTKKSKFNAIKDVVLELHNYEVCEISYIDITDANSEWLAWIDEEVGED